MKKIRWSKAPEGYPVWIEDLRDPERSEWHRDDGDRYTCQSGRYWTKPEEGFYRVYINPAPVQAWDGEALPPVGEVIEWLDGEFIPAVVVGHHHGAVVAVDQDDPRRVFIGKKPIYRPLRTPEQIAAEDREKAVGEMIDMFRLSQDNQELLRAICFTLHDAGFRKQVTP